MKIVSMMIFGAGYVLGARAGRERYEEIRALAARTMERIGEPDAGRISDYSRRLEALANGAGADVNGSRPARANS